MRSNLIQRLCPAEYVLGHSFSITESDTLDLELLRSNLVTGNYVAMNQVMAPGEFAIRGGVIDVFPMGSRQPFRLDMFDDEVESIRLFDPESQRSTEKVYRIEILPAREFPLNDAGILRFRARFRQIFEADPQSQVIYREVSAGRTCPGTGGYR